MKKLFFLIILLFLLVMAAKSNPSKQAYEHWLKDKAMNKTNNQVEKKAISVFGNTVISKNTTSHNYVVFTVFRTSYQGHQIQVFGAYDHFIPFSESNS